MKYTKSLIGTEAYTPLKARNGWSREIRTKVKYTCLEESEDTVTIINHYTRSKEIMNKSDWFTMVRHSKGLI